MIVLCEQYSVSTVYQASLPCKITLSGASPVFQRAAKQAMALSMDKWLRTDPSDHNSSISSFGSYVGGASRVVSFSGLGFHVGRCERDDLVLSDCERDVASSYRTLRCVK